MQTSTHIPRSTNGGFSLVEMILYIALLAIVVSSLVQTGVSLYRTMTYMRASEEVAYDAMLTLDRITREVRFASSVDIGASTLDTHPGVLELNTTDDTGTPTSMTFAVTGGRVTVAEGAGAASPLTHSNVSVNNLVFTRMTNAESEGVLVELTLSRTVNTTAITRSFRTFVVLDAS